MEQNRPAIFFAHPVKRRKERVPPLSGVSWLAIMRVIILVEDRPGSGYFINFIFRVPAWELIPGNYASLIVVW